MGAEYTIGIGKVALLSAERRDKMTIKEICTTLAITRQGLYWMLKEHKKEIRNHAIQRPNGRWQIDEKAVDILREIQKKSKKVIVEKAPADPHVAEEIRGMQLVIDRLTEANELLKLKAYQGLLLADAMDNVLADYDFEPEAQRAIRLQIKYYKSHTTAQSLKRELKKQKKAGLM